MDFYSDDQRQLQDQFETRTLADTLEASIVHSEVPHEHAAFIGSRDFFFLSTVSASGEPTVSYKGGPTGVVKVLDSKTLAFPIYDGNGMFLSAGNVTAANKIGLLFMDFETPHRVRVQASAVVSDSADDLVGFPGALVVVKATVDACFCELRSLHPQTQQGRNFKARARRRRRTAAGTVEANRCYAGFVVA